MKQNRFALVVVLAFMALFVIYRFWYVVAALGISLVVNAAELRVVEVPFDEEDESPFVGLLQVEAGDASAGTDARPTALICCAWHGGRFAQ